MTRKQQSNSTNGSVCSLASTQMDFNIFMYVPCVCVCAFCLKKWPKNSLLSSKRERSDQLILFFVGLLFRYFHTVLQYVECGLGWTMLRDVRGDGKKKVKLFHTPNSTHKKPLFNVAEKFAQKDSRCELFSLLFSSTLFALNASNGRRRKLNRNYLQLWVIDVDNQGIQESLWISIHCLYIWRVNFCVNVNFVRKKKFGSRKDKFWLTKINWVSERKIKNKVSS